MPTAPPSALEAPTPLLCCICSEKNTTFRYEVVYSQQNKSITLLESPRKDDEERQCLTHNGQNNSLEESSSVSENQYYNFPPRHPRHGHLSWPVWTPTSSNIQANTSQLSITYPDHPIHIPTLTLRRLYTQLASQGGAPGILGIQLN